jgi:hypothetical protein
MNAPRGGEFRKREVSDMNKMIRHARIGGVFVAAVAALFALCGCHQTRYNWVLRDVDATLPKITGNERPRERAGTPAELLAVHPGNKTMLVTSLIHDNPDKIDDEWSETFVCLIDGPVIDGRFYELTPDNCRLILNAVFRPCREPYHAVEGKITILSVGEGKVQAKCVFREMIRSAREEGHILREVLTFKPPTGQELRLRQAGLLIESSEQAK